MQYAGRLAQRCAFYSQMVRDFAEYPVLSVGTKLDESPLWQHFELEGVRDKIARTPPGLLVTQEVTGLRAPQRRAQSLRRLARRLRRVEGLFAALPDGG